MQHLGTQTIETERLILRRFTMEDVQAMYDNWASDDDVTRYLTWPTHSDLSITEMVLKSWVDSYAGDDFYNWAIELKSLGQPIGNIAVVRIREHVSSAEIGYCMGKTWWHQGIMSEALTAVMDYLFDRVGMNRVQAEHAVDNPNSGGVMLKCGMTCEGTLRQYGRCNQGIVDLKIYSMIASDRK
jgi:ribosomal-protein-alanine N-acetyltransferase